jgi:hypothetical protein
MFYLSVLIQQYSYRELVFDTYLQIIYKTRLLIFYEYKQNQNINYIHGRWNKNHLCITLLNGSNSGRTL